MIHPTVWARTAIRELVAKAIDEEVFARIFGPQIKETTSRRIHLTFDDGPHLVNTPRLLDVLERFGVSATFFVTGRNLGTPQAQDLLARMVSEGHQIGNHTYSHRHLTKLSEQEIREEILKTEILIGDSNRGIKVFRPPFGDHDSRVDRIVRKLGYRLVLWNVDTLDWHPEYQDHWVKHAMTQIVAQRDTCVLAHDPLTTTVDQVENLIENIASTSDREFVPLSDSFHDLAA
jgi:peptidoglycan-N-acetylglucosamine deacetylase